MPEALEYGHFVWPSLTHAIGDFTSFQTLISRLLPDYTWVFCTTTFLPLYFPSLSTPMYHLATYNYITKCTGNHILNSSDILKPGSLSERREGGEWRKGSLKNHRDDFLLFTVSNRKQIVLAICKILSFKKKKISST